MEHLIGRQKEIDRLNHYANSQKSEFIAIYGRRRVGKTYLIREIFKHQFAFQMTGLNNASLQAQLSQFQIALRQYGQNDDTILPAKNWLTAFNQLINLLETKETKSKKIIFLDELPWFDTPKSKFLMGLEYFWNSWASARRDIVLIVCGSENWIKENLLNNTGGLYNRVTQRIELSRLIILQKR